MIHLVLRHTPRRKFRNGYEEDCIRVVPLAESEKMRFSEKRNESLKKSRKGAEKWREKKKY